MNTKPDMALRFTSEIPGQKPRKPSITIEGVPASVTREQVDEAIRVLGIDPKEICALRFDFLGDRGRGLLYGQARHSRLSLDA